MRLRLDAVRPTGGPRRRRSFGVAPHRERLRRDTMTAVAGTPADQRRSPLLPRLTPLRRVRRVLALALWMCSIPVAVSDVTTMLGPSNPSFAIRSFEWLCDHGAAQIASEL